ncbi:MAG: hypothetical protein MHMPM18_001596 [Marteilia pararefringens]
MIDIFLQLSLSSWLILSVSKFSKFRNTWESDSDFFQILRVTRFLSALSVTIGCFNAILATVFHSFDAKFAFDKRYTKFCSIASRKIGMLLSFTIFSALIANLYLIGHPDFSTLYHSIINLIFSAYKYVFFCHKLSIEEWIFFTFLTSINWYLQLKTLIQLIKIFRIEWDQSLLNDGFTRPAEKNQS